MHNIGFYAKTVCATIGGAIAWVYGGWNDLILILVAAVSLDFITGLIAAGIQHKLCSSVCYNGILRKVMIFLVVGLAAIVDRLMGTDATLRNAACIFYIVNEALSILENTGRAGVPYPEKIKTIILALNDKLQEDADDIGGQ